ncbi:hypothetical protein DSL92_07810 [Billgrantia gudaonensis]|uniref:Uncharacterized protein n=1 Tax=Billgrantia gudaonensis TaxID=376427 RepID=A0A3S0NH19_9GAMM|nr:hypothetical protein DSL92_07810 [Halomonas gudaonensis]
MHFSPPTRRVVCRLTAAVHAARPGLSHRLSPLTADVGAGHLAATPGRAPAGSGLRAGWPFGAQLAATPVVAAILRPAIDGLMLADLLLLWALIVDDALPRAFRRSPPGCWPPSGVGQPCCLPQCRRLWLNG